MQAITDAAVAAAIALIKAAGRADLLAEGHAGSSGTSAQPQKQVSVGKAAAVASCVFSSSRPPRGPGKSKLRKDSEEPAIGQCPAKRKAKGQREQGELEARTERVLQAVGLAPQLEIEAADHVKGGEESEGEYAVEEEMLWHGVAGKEESDTESTEREDATPHWVADGVKCELRTQTEGYGKDMGECEGAAHALPDTAIHLPIQILESTMAGSGQCDTDQGMTTTPSRQEDHSQRGGPSAERRVTAGERDAAHALPDAAIHLPSEVLDSAMTGSRLRDTDERMKTTPARQEDHSQPGGQSAEQRVTAGERDAAGALPHTAIRLPPRVFESTKTCDTDERMKTTPSRQEDHRQRGRPSAEQRGISGERHCWNRRARIWILGHSTVLLAGRQAEKSPIGRNLGHGPEVLEVSWLGRNEMKWGQLLPNLCELKEAHLPPDVLILHLGEEDLGKLTCLELIKIMKRELRIVKSWFPGVALFWTRLLPRREWEGIHSYAGVNKGRREVNRELAKFCFSQIIGVIDHYEFKADRPWLFTEDGVDLSFLGNEKYLAVLVNVVNAFMEKWQRR